MSEEVITRDRSSGRLHRQTLREDGRLASFEGCNLDDAGEAEILTPEEAAKALEMAEPWMLCHNCFPPIPAPEDAA